MRRSQSGVARMSVARSGAAAGAEAEGAGAAEATADGAAAVTTGAALGAGASTCVFVHEIEQTAARPTRRGVRIAHAYYGDGRQSISAHVRARSAGRAHAAKTAPG